MLNTRLPQKNCNFYSFFYTLFLLVLSFNAIFLFFYSFFYVFLCILLHCFVLFPKNSPTFFFCIFASAQLAFDFSLFSCSFFSNLIFFLFLLFFDQFFTQLFMTFLLNFVFKYPSNLLFSFFAKIFEKISNFSVIKTF